MKWNGESTHSVQMRSEERSPTFRDVSTPTARNMNGYRVWVKRILPVSDQHCSSCVRLPREVVTVMLTAFDIHTHARIICRPNDTGVASCEPRQQTQTGAAAANSGPPSSQPPPTAHYAGAHSTPTPPTQPTTPQ